MTGLENMQSGAVQYRAAEIVDTDRDKSELLLKAVPYSVPTEIGGDITETFMPGAFAKSAKAPERLLVWANHSGPVVGRGTEVNDRPDGVWIRARIGRSQAARDMIGDIIDGIADSCSIEFAPQRDFMRIERRGDGYAVTHRRAHLLGVAVVPVAAYDDARVVSVREDAVEREREKMMLWFEQWRSA